MKLRHPIWAIILLFAGCNINDLEFDNVKLQDLTPSVAVPLGFATYTVEELFYDVIEDTTVFESDDGSQIITLIYSDTSHYEADEDLVNIEDINSSGGLNPMLNVTAGSLPVVIPLEKEFTFEYPANNEEQIDSVFYESGKLSYRIISNFQGEVDINILIHNTVNTLNDEAVAFDVVIPAKGVHEGSTNLVNHKTFLSQGNLQNTFKASISGDLTIFPGDGISEFDSLIFELTYEDQEFEQIFGYFGIDTINVSTESINFDFLSKATGEGLYLNAPEISLSFNNSFGIPFGLSLDNIYGKNSSRSDSTFLTGQITSDIQLVDYNKENIFEPVETEIEINKDNSSIQDLIAFGPDDFYFPITGYTNPENENQSNYLTNQSSMETVVTIFMPLEVRLENFQQTLDFKINGVFDQEEIDSVALIVTTVNELPFDGRIKLFFDDSLAQVLYESLTIVVFDSPEFNIEGDLIGPVESTSSINLDREALIALRETYTIRAVFEMSSPRNTRREYFSLYNSQALRINLSLAGSTNLKF